MNFDIVSNSIKFTRLHRINKACLFFLFIFGAGCNKMVQIDPPRNSITTPLVFADSADATGAILGIYTNFLNGGSGGISFGSGYFSIYCGLSADELLPFSNTGAYEQLSDNNLLASNGLVYGIWSNGYTYLYQANAIIEGLQASTSIPESVKNELIGEAKWFRAFIDFYLVNIFGDIPLVTSTSYLANQVISRTSTAQVYQSILDDLKSAQSLLPADYSAGGGQRIRVNNWTATALLARVYLYTNDYADAEAQASSVINNTSLYSLSSSPDSAFLANSSEAILQLEVEPNLASTGNLTPEGSVLIPSSATSPPYCYVTSQLFNAFEPGDLRQSSWLDSTKYSGTVYYYPYKYKIGPNQYSTSGPAKEYYMVLRLAEQYLIYAEAVAMQNTNLSNAITDLNIIRHRANLPDLSSSLNQSQVLAAVAQERRIEFFAEWGHRWFDLKRTNQANTVLSSIPSKNPWNSYQLLYPIPLGELALDPDLTQNTGY
jgi:hypothetical protein